MGAQLYTGPKIQDRLEDIAPNLNLVVDYGILWWVAQPLFAVLSFIQSGEINFFGMDVDLGGGVGNWGIAIILLTVLIKLAFFKLSAMSYRSMANMRKVAPKMAEINARFGDNRGKAWSRNDEAVQRREDQSIEWLFADPSTDASIHCFVLGIDGIGRTSPSAVLSVD